MRMICFLFIFSAFTSDLWAQSFQDSYTLLQGKNFFKAKSNYLKDAASYTSVERSIIEAFLYNAFNDPSKSIEIITKLSQQSAQIPDTIMVQLWNIQTDNFIKLYRYRDAKNCIQKILETYGYLLTEEEAKDLHNVLKIWTTFQDEPAQKIKLHNPKPMKLERDKAGLKNLKIRTPSDSSLFIFDTGANLSSVSLSTAHKLDMKIFPVSIEVGSITGKKVEAQLAICPIMHLGEIDIQHAIFLVFNDESLYFKEIDYQINGILGFPVIEALDQVTITKSDYFSVTTSTGNEGQNSNMALDGLFPLILLDGKHFTFDTGADETILYHAYYAELKEEIERKYEKEKIRFSGAGGSREYEGYKIDFAVQVNQKKVRLRKIQVLTEKLNPSETVYGNIGQDLIQKYASMTINFDRMYIRFE